MALTAVTAGSALATPPGQSPVEAGKPSARPDEPAPPRTAGENQAADEQPSNARPGEAPDGAKPNTDVPPSPGKRPENGYWSEGEPRWFVSTKSDIGTPYLKPYFSAGYGLPHFIWAGVDVNSITTLEFTQVYAGVRAATPVFDLAFGFRDTWSFSKAYLAPKQSFTSDDVFDDRGPRARYWAWEAEAVGILPLPYSALVADFILIKTLDVPSGKYIYEESYRAVVGKPLYAVLRVAAVARILNEGALKVGPLLEHVFTTGRSAPVTRFGPAVSFQITDHLEAQGALTLVVSSPDSLGLTLGAYGVAGLRYRWATGENKPRWPWQEHIIP